MSRTMKVMVTAMIALAAIGSVASSTSAQPAAPAANAKATATDTDSLGGFHLVLLAATTTPAPRIENVTPAVAKAVADVQQFLPFKGYELLDSMLIRGSRGGTTRISGGNKVIYVAQIERVSGCFSSPPGGVLPCAVDVKIGIPGEIATKLDAAGSSSVEVKEPVISSHLTMNLGETVVVGSSRTNDAVGLVAVLTALPRSALK